MTRGADFVSMRRLSELLGATSPAAFARLCALLARHRSRRCSDSLYRSRDRSRTSR